MNGQTQGPYGLEQVVQGIQSGQVTPQTLVWNPSLSGWIAASQVPQLGTYFAPAPPPLPPAK